MKNSTSIPLLLCECSRTFAKCAKSGVASANHFPCVKVQQQCVSFRQLPATRNPYRRWFDSRRPVRIRTAQCDLWTSALVLLSNVRGRIRSWRHVAAQPTDAWKKCSVMVRGYVLQNRSCFSFLCVLLAPNYQMFLRTSWTLFLCGFFQRRKTQVYRYTTNHTLVSAERAPKYTHCVKNKTASYQKSTIYFQSATENNSSIN